MIYLISVGILIGIILAFIFIFYGIGVLLNINDYNSYSFWVIFGIGLAYITLIGAIVFVFMIVLFRLVIPWVSSWGIKTIGG